MKKKQLIFSFIALLISFGAIAQIEKGRLLVSGSVGFNFTNYSEVVNGNTTFEYNSINLWLMPKAGYFITDQIVIGLGLDISTQSTKYDDDDKYIFSSLFFTPFARYYFPQGFFGQLELGIGSETQVWKEPDEEDDKDRYNAFLWSLGVGYAHFLNDHVAIEPIVSFTGTTYTDKEFTDYKTKNIVILLQIGLSIYIDR